MYTEDAIHAALLEHLVHATEQTALAASFAFGVGVTTSRARRPELALLAAETAERSMRAFREVLAASLGDACPAAWSLSASGPRTSAPDHSTPPMETGF